jgi:hypothetical protein
LRLHARHEVDPFPGHRLKRPLWFRSAGITEQALQAFFTRFASFNTLGLRDLSEVRSLLRLKSRAPAVKRFLTHF